MDVWRAYFHAPSRSLTYVMISEEDMSEGDQRRCAELNASLHCTRDAHKKWKNKYSSGLVKMEFWRGRANLLRVLT